jgi:GntR family transcriptional regulator
MSNSALAAELARIDSRLPLYVRLRDVLTRRITAGEWAPDEAIPAESGLAEAYGVSLGTMRKALQQLVDEGLLERRQGSGTYVRRARFDRSLFRFFRHGAAAIGDGAIPASRILRREIVPASALPDAALGLAADEQVIRLQRLRLWDDKPFLAEDIAVPLGPMTRLMDTPTDQFGPLLYPTYEALCGQIIARAHEELTVVPADGVVGRLLRCPVGTPMIEIRRTAFLHDDRPIEWRRSHGLASEFHYNTEIR